MCSAGIGELAASILGGQTPDWIDAAAVSPGRLEQEEGRRGEQETRGGEKRK
jgi:hypothetical protein